MKMRPAFKDYLWGGDSLVTRYGKKTQMRPVAESWEISCYPGNPSVVENGEFAGKTLPEVLKLYPRMQGRGTGIFPVLIKLIDAKSELSLQVHPGDEYSGRVENQAGKNEMWYVMDCEPDSELIIGFKEPLSKEEIRQSILDGTILQRVNRVKVKPGDCFPIPAGLLHAIGKGIIIAEIQQNSDVTYRVYDYGRKDARGLPRELHIDKAVDVIDTSLVSENLGGNQAERFDGYTVTRLTDWEYFEACLIRVDGRAALSRDESGFGCLLVTEGSVTVRSGEYILELKAGESAFIPAGLGKYSLEGTAKVIITTY